METKKTRQLLEMCCRDLPNIKRHLQSGRAASTASMCCALHGSAPHPPPGTTHRIELSKFRGVQVKSWSHRRSTHGLFSPNRDLQLSFPEVANPTQQSSPAQWISKVIAGGWNIEHGNHTNSLPVMHHTIDAGLSSAGKHKVILQKVHHFRVLFALSSPPENKQPYQRHTAQTVCLKTSSPPEHFARLIDQANLSIQSSFSHS